MMVRSALVGVCLLGLVGCSKNADRGGSSHRSARVVAPATPSQQAALLDKMKSLAGEWNTMAGENGTPGGTAVFTVTSNGSAVREVMMPGTPMEMTNVYHMDGNSLVVTHYCAMGNQPKMRAVAGSNSNSIDFKFDSVSNLRKADEMYMGELEIEFVDANTIKQHWTSLQSGKKDEHATFTLKRK